MTFVATTSATKVTLPPEFSRKKADPTSEDIQHEGSVFVLTATKKGCYIIHPDWVSEEQVACNSDKRKPPPVDKPKPPPVDKPCKSLNMTTTKKGCYIIHPDWVSEEQVACNGDKLKLLPVVKPCKSLDSTGVQRGHYIIAPDWVSEGNRFPCFNQGRSHKPWPFEFKGARHWPDQSLDRHTPAVRASCGAELMGSRPATGIHLIEHQSGWMPTTFRQAIAPVTTSDGLPSYSYNRAFSTSYGDHFNKTALGAFNEGPRETGRAVMPWRSYNSWNVYSKELARSRREAPPRPSYMLPSASSWVP